MYKQITFFCLILSGLIMFNSCSSSTSSDDPDDREPIEPSATITGPGNGDVLSGVVTIAAAAEAQNGIEELRFFLGDTQLFSTDSSPSEYELDTREYANGEYVIRIEAEPAEEDTLLTESVTVQLENYLVELDTQNLASVYKTVLGESEFYKELTWYVLISAPDGRVLAEQKLTNDGILRLLPPEALPDGAPRYYNVTLADHFVDNGDFESLYLTTYTGIESWTRYETFRLDEPVESHTVDVELTNIPEDTYAIVAIDEYGYVPYFRRDTFTDWSSTGSFQRSFSHPEDRADWIIAVIPSSPPYESGDLPRFYWVDDLQEQETINLDVDEEFQEISSFHSVSYPSSIVDGSVSHFISADEDFWDYSGSLFIPGKYFNQESGSGMEMFLLNENRPLLTSMAGYDASENDLYHIQRVRGLPSAFEPSDMSVTVTSASVDDIRLQTSGTADILTLITDNFGTDPSYYSDWYVSISDTTTTFVFPSIANSLGQKIIKYNRNDYRMYEVWATDYEAADGYDEVIVAPDYNGDLSEYRQVIKGLNTAKQKRTFLKTKGIGTFIKRQKGDPLHHYHRSYRRIK